MRRYVGLALILLLSKFCFSQDKEAKTGDGVIKGRVIDSASAQPVDYATVTVFLINNDKPVSGATTNAKGLFNIDHILPGRYRLVVDFIGFRTKEKKDIEQEQKT